MFSRELNNLCAISALLVACVAMLCSGCVSKSKAQLQAREAYLAGQQQALKQNAGPAVSVVGLVKNRNIPWDEELTLSRAIVSAQYHGFSDPKTIIVIRNGETTQISPKALLRGQDVLLQPGDVVQLR